MIDIAKFESIHTKNISDHISIADRLNGRRASKDQFDDSDLQAIQQNFYNLMYYRCRNADNCIQWLDENTSELPKITNVLLATTEPEWIPIPGMYGGFAYGLIERDGKPLLIADSWVRIVGGSGQTHEISPSSVTLTAEGYV